MCQINQVFIYFFDIQKMEIYIKVMKKKNKLDKSLKIM